MANDRVITNIENPIVDFSMYITKASIKDGEMRWASTNSDVDKDLYGERMSMELFQDFISHIQTGDFPEQFKSVICEPEWCGGTPYVSLSHYKTGTNKANVPGELSSIYLENKCLKSKGIMYDTPLGRAVFKSMQEDFVTKREDKVRISIGFLDTEHSHGDKFTFVRKSLGQKCPLCKEGIGDKIYKKGYLVHLALTRVPANPRTDTELELKSMPTKLEDLESIVGDEDVIKGLDLKSAAEEVLVIKSDDEECEEGDEECKKKKMHSKESKESEEKSVAEPVVEPVVEPVLSVVDKAIMGFGEKVKIMKSQGLSGDAALTELQTSFEELGSVVRAEFTPAPTPEDATNRQIAELRSAVADLAEVVRSLTQTVPPMQSEVMELRALSNKAPVLPEQVIPQPRSLNVNLVQKAAVEKLQKVSSFDLIARQSVGL